MLNFPRQCHQKFDHIFLPRCNLPPKSEGPKTKLSIHVRMLIAFNFTRLPKNIRVAYKAKSVSKSMQNTRHMKLDFYFVSRVAFECRRAFKYNNKTAAIWLSSSLFVTDFKFWRATKKKNDFAWRQRSFAACFVVYPPDMGGERTVFAAVNQAPWCLEVCSRTRLHSPLRRDFVSDSHDDVGGTQEKFRG